MAELSLEVAVETWPVDGTFTISRGTRREATVVVVTVRDAQFTGRGEAVPYARYGETADSTVALIRSLTRVGNREGLRDRLPPGAARNAVDCALWDLEAKQTGRTVADLADVPPPQENPFTCYTLSLGSADDMAAKAHAARDKPLLKLKLAGPEDDARMRSVRVARPDARLVADANEAWTAAELGPLLTVARKVGIELVEQPLPAGNEGALGNRPRGVPICADESFHTSADLTRVAGLYDAVNIKLDKTGGLTEALATARAAKGLGLGVMIGCMLSTSLAMAPAAVLAPFADWLDLDGPLLLARDRASPIAYRDGRMLLPPPRALWG